MDTSPLGLRHAPGNGQVSPAATYPAVDDLADILLGLTASPKTLPSRLFYDALGCVLFGQITLLDEYYVTRCEMELLRAHGAEMVACTAPLTALVEYGASEESKATLLLDAGAERFCAYVPIDIAAPALVSLQGRMRATHPRLEVCPVVGDFTTPLTLPATARDCATLGFFPGSTIGNFEPEMVISFLRQARRDLSRRGGPARFIIGTDLRKDASILLPAYDDALGVTAAFNRNILRHVSLLTGARFDPEMFAHRAIWNEADGRIEMHLVSRLPQVIMVGGHKIAFGAGETIHTESSYKHTPEGFLALAARAGWRPDGFWTGSDQRFGLHRLIAAP